MNVTLPEKTVNNGSYYIHFALLEPGTDLNQPLDMNSVISATYSRITRYSQPKLEAFNLMGSNSTGMNDSRPVTHLHTRVTLSVMTEDVSFSRLAVPAELHSSLRIKQHPYSYLPILVVDRLSLRQKDLVVSGHKTLYDLITTILIYCDGRNCRPTIT